MKKHLFFIFLLLNHFGFISAYHDYEQITQDFVLESKRIVIPEQPHAFNPSIIRWNGEYLLSFRVIADPIPSAYPYCAAESKLYLVWLDDEFDPICAPQEIKLKNSEKPFAAVPDDGRLVKVGNDLYLIYSDNINKVIDDSGFRMMVAKLCFNGETFEVVEQERLLYFEGQDSLRREKNWTAFDYQGNLLLSYNLSPHKIFLPLMDGSGACETFATSYPSIVWDWADPRGGTPALLVDDENYLSLFHSSLECSTMHSDGESVLHYFMGAYTFSRETPFEIKKISPEPIVGKNFYSGEIYDPYWKPVRVVFPCGLIIDEDLILVTYGRQDHEMWIAKMDKKKLLDSLINVTTLRAWTNL